jgi:hypothetical protein
MHIHLHLWNFSLPPPDSFSLFKIPILPLVKKFGIYFPIFFSWIRNSERVIQIFFWIYTRKSSGSKFRTFVSLGLRAKLENRGGEKELGTVGREKFILLEDCGTSCTISFFLNIYLYFSLFKNNLVSLQVGRLFWRFELMISKSQGNNFTIAQGLIK